MTNMAKVTSLKLGHSCVLILRLSADPIDALHRTNRTGKTNIQNGGMNTIQTGDFEPSGLEP